MGKALLCSEAHPGAGSTPRYPLRAQCPRASPKLVSRGGERGARISRVRTDLGSPTPEAFTLC